MLLAYWRRWSPGWTPPPWLRWADSALQRLFRTIHCTLSAAHDDVIKWKHFLRYWPFGRIIHWSPLNFPHKASDAVICACINSWVNNREAGDLRRHRAHYDVTVMSSENRELTKCQICVSGATEVTVLQPLAPNMASWWLSVFNGNTPICLRHQRGCRWPGHQQPPCWRHRHYRAI